MAVTVHWGSATHVGCVRTSNQDSVLSGPTVFAVADGMGGHAAGDVASAIAVARMAQLEADASGDDVLAAVRSANHEVMDQGAPGSGREGMGTTISGVAVVARDDEDALLVFNVGDSRTYLFDGAGLSQVTTDHSLVAEMVRSGELAPNLASAHKARNVVTRALGIEREIEVDHWWVAPKPGQVFLLCSDGLTNEVSPSVIEGVLRAASSPQAAVDSLLGIALDAGARDNISAIAVQVQQVSSEPTELDDTTGPRPTAVEPADVPAEPDHREPVRRSENGRTEAVAGEAGAPDLIDAVPGADRQPTPAAHPRL